MVDIPDDVMKLARKIWQAALKSNYRDEPATIAQAILADRAEREAQQDNAADNLILSLTKSASHLQAELSRVKAERDEAVGLLKPLGAHEAIDDADMPDRCGVPVVLRHLRAARSFITRMEAKP